MTFAAIGYGDISPISPEAKMMSMIIALTSTLCLTIFVLSVLSYKNQD
ncbi:ion channel [Terrisporobacter sp.]